MKTEELIRVLAADGARPVIPIGHTLSRALMLGAVLSTALFFLILHPRADIGAAVQTLRFDFKLVVVGCVAAGAALFVAYAALPAPTGRRQRLLWLGPLLLAVGVILELATAPVSSWFPRWLGHNATHCLSLIPLLSLPARGCLLFALRRAAPVRPAVAGAAAGLLSGGIGAILYALSCPDDSPLFVATWYSLAIGAVTAIAAFVSSRWLRW
jgi:hypothetical protein